MLVLLAAVAPLVVGPVPSAGAVGAAACVIGGTMTFSAPSGSPATGTWSINPGQIDCNGALNGYRILGAGPFTGRGTYTALTPLGGPCLHLAGTGDVDYRIESGAMVFHMREAQRFLLAGAGEFSTPTLRGTLQLAPPYEGDCLTEPLSRATFTAQALILWTAPFFLPHTGAGKA
jgi:hypothetical protein